VPFPLPARLAWRAEATLIDFALTDFDLADFGLADFALADFVFDLALAAMSVSGMLRRGGAVFRRASSTALF
jgi:hypothetical protein